MGTHQLPIHVAAMMGLKWTDGFGYIMNTYLPAISIKDPVTGLYPFMLAAASCDVDSSSDKEERQSSADLTVIFELLREKPDLMQIEYRSSVTPSINRKRMDCSGDEEVMVQLKKMKTCFF